MEPNSLNKGSVLIISMMFMFVLMILVMAFLKTVMFNVKINGQQYNEAQALYLAEAGINKAIYYLRNTAPNSNTTGTWSTNAYPGGTANTSAAACSSTNPCSEPLYSQSGTYTYSVYPNGSSYPVVGTYTVWVTNSQYSCGYGECIQIISQGKVGNVTKTIERYVTEDTSSSYNGLYATPIFDQWEECTSSACPNITNNLQGWWRMDDYAASNTVLDSSGNANSGTYNPATSAYYTNNSGANTVSVAGIIAGSAPAGFSSTGTGALSFDGSSEYVTIPSSASINVAGAITMSAWIYPTTCSSGNYVILWKASQYSITLGYISSACRISYSDSSNWSWNNFGYYGSVSLNAWHHIVATKDTSNNVNIYLDGALQNSQSFGSSITTTVSPLYIGSNSTPGSYFAGYIDDVRVYNRALSSDEVQMLYNFR